MKNEEYEETSIPKGQRDCGYRVLVAILVTCACLLDVYGSMGCDFIRLEIGFEPVNDVWQDSGAQFGLFYFDSPGTITKKRSNLFDFESALVSGESGAGKSKTVSPKTATTNSNFALMNKGCQVYSTSFEDNFISADISWNSSRFMAYVTGICGVLGTVAAWLLAINPCSWLSKTMWMIVLRVTMVLSTCAGAAMFVFFNTDICTADLWLEDEQSNAVAAESCRPGESAIFGFASCLAFFICSIIVLMRSPARQEEEKHVAGEGTVKTSPTDMIIDTLERGEGTQLELVPEREDYQIGELLRHPSHMTNDLPESCVLQFVNELETNDCCFVKRSAGDFFSYAQLDYRTAEELIFQMCREGSTKSIKRKHWAKSLRFPTTEGLERAHRDATPQRVEISTPKMVNGQSARHFTFSDDSTLGTAEFAPEPNAEIEQPRTSKTTTTGKCKGSFQIQNFTPDLRIKGTAPRVAILNGTGVLGESVAVVTDFNSTPLNLLSNVLIWVEDARNLNSCFEYYRDIDMEGFVVHTHGGKPLSTRRDFEAVSGRKLEDQSWEQMKRKFELEKELTGMDKLIDSFIDEAKEAVRGLG